MTSIISALALGVIQGITEFLPISSTGHLIIAEYLLAVSEKRFGLSFDVALHIGTAVALIAIFYQDIKMIIKKSVTKRFFSPLLFALIIGTIPAGIVGLLLEDYVESYFRSPTIVAFDLFLFSGLLLWGDFRAKRKGKTLSKVITPFNAFIIGTFQALAIIPGVSRSGATITGGLATSHDRSTSARFAFLLSIPIILLAGAKQTIDIFLAGAIFTTNQLLFFLIGFTTAAIVAFIVVKWFLHFFQKHGFLPFVIYRIVLATGVFVLLG